MEAYQPTCTGGFELGGLDRGAVPAAEDVVELMMTWSYGPLTPADPQALQRERAAKPEATPCEETSVIDPTNPEYNICFEGTPEPISTLPDLLARYQAEEAANTLLGKVSELHNQSFGHIAQHERAPHALAARPWQAALIDSIERSTRQPESPLTCHEYSELCRSLPPALPGASLLSLVVPVSPVALDAPAYPELNSPPAQLALERLRVGPSLEHARLLEMPPRQG
ncbi:hypothetical protein DL240_17040 [Lujinxingia litoralis]|uniref:Uncharacterized protein n=2 Tax=Lujinxingia litoralis TaxID=2211119 RepID=A0A328C3L1_9DELT|nr:hypothetical protein DL240_17040 [Lujinxingia litoralis]